MTSSRVLCMNCRHYAGPESRQLGWCHHFRVETFPDEPFLCADYLFLFDPQPYEELIMPRPIALTRNSRYLTKEECDPPRRLTIASVDLENVAPAGNPPEQRYVVHFREVEKGLVLNYTNAELVAQSTGSQDMDDWPGHLIELFHDPNVSFGQRLVGGIRVRSQAAPAYQAMQSIAATPPQPAAQAGTAPYQTPQPPAYPAPGQAQPASQPTPHGAPAGPAATDPFGDDVPY